ncbi:hypothetical protein QR680_008109 [Steinernema hermaphroditum]|uniref:Uncharacterized protein n=1 Tax=Steinernema hermaphroditum TaxID=289476 RepID=A0AA39IGZ3_9BILA|nr:hypothetical protein QR680_008109 [Steinernema hermaphroditum]
MSTRVVEFGMNHAIGHNWDDELKDFMQGLIDSVHQSAGDTSTVFGFTFTHPALENAVHIPFRTRNQNTAEVMMRRLQHQTQSRGLTTFNNEMKIVATALHPPSGRGRVKDTVEAHLAIKVNHKSILKIKNTDSLCLARAIVVAIAAADLRQFKNEKLIQMSSQQREQRVQNCDTLKKRVQRLKSTESMQRKKALELLRNAGVRTD